MRDAELAALQAESAAIRLSQRLASRLPTHPPGRSAASGKRASGERRHVYRVLIVDDDEDARVLLKRALGKSALALEVAAADDGLQALEAVARTRPHAVITDVMMPRMNGFDLCAALRTDPATADIPVIMVTALRGRARPPARPRRRRQRRT